MTEKKPGDNKEGGRQSDGGEKSSEKKRSLMEELVVVLLMQRSAKGLAGLVKEGELSDEAMSVVLVRAKKGMDNEKQERLLTKIAKNIGGEEGDEVRNDLAKLLEMQDKEVKTNITGKGKTKKYQKQAGEIVEKIGETVKPREGVTKLWSEVNKELSEVAKKVEKKEMEEVRKAMKEVRENIYVSVEKGLETPLSAERKQKIKKEVGELYKRIVKRKEKPTHKQSFKERMNNMVKSNVESKGMEVVGRFYEAMGDEGKVEKLFDEMSDDDYTYLIVFREQIERDLSDENSAEVYELSRRIEKSWNEDRASKAWKEMSVEQNMKVKRNLKRREMPDFKNDEEAIRWIMKNNVLNQDGISELEKDPEKLERFLNQLDETLNLKKSGYGGGQERMRNINWDELDDVNDEIKLRWKKEGFNLNEDAIDMSPRDEGRAPVVNKNIEGRAREIIEEVLLQELLKEGRILVSESVERASMYYDERAQRYMTLLALGGVDTTIKDTATNHMMMLQLSYAWRNGYADEELHGKVMNFFSRQGPEYRLYEELKRNEVMIIKNKEGKEVRLEMNIYDYDGVLAQNVPQEYKDELGMFTMDDDGGKIYVDRSWGTVLARTTDSEAMKHDRKLFVKHMLTSKYGEKGFAEKAKEVGENELLTGMVEDYGDYVSRAYLYLIGTGRLGEVVGNGSYDNSKFDLVQGIPEYYMKRDPRLLIRFMWKYTPVRVPEVLFGLERMGLPSFHAKMGKETAAHFVSSGDTTEGAKGGRSTFFVSREGVDDKVLDEACEEWNELLKEAIYNDNEYEFGGKENPFYEAISHQEDQARPRRNNTETINILLDFANEKDETYFELISWKWAEKKYKHDRELVKVLGDEKISGKDKYIYFMERFNDGYFVTDALKAKHGDYQLKYLAGYQQKFFEALMEYGSNPEPENLAALAEVVASIVGPNVGEFRDKTAKIIFEVLKQRKPGEALSVIEYEGGSVAFDEDAYSGFNKGEMPLPRIKKVVHNPLDRDIKTDSTASYRGLEDKVYEPELLWKVLMRNMRAANLYRDEDEYREARKEARKEQRGEFFGGWKWDSDIGAQWNVLYNAKNAWDIVALKKMTKYLAMEVFDLPPHLFWEWVAENSEKTMGTVMQYMNN